MISINLTSDAREDAQKIEETLARLERDVFVYAWTAAGTQAAKLILRQRGLQRYPPQRRGMPQPFVSDRQRRYFFWALAQGIIEVPYRRGKSARSERYGTQFYVESHPRNLTTIVGNRASYARWLTDKDQQSGYMAARGWRKLKEVALEQEDNIVAIYDRWIQQALKRIGLSEQ